MKNRLKIKKSPMSLPLNTTLLIGFSLLLLFIVAVLGIGEYYLLNRAYAEQVRNEQVAMSKTMYEMISDVTNSPITVKEKEEFLNTYIFKKANSSAVNMYILDESGNVIYPRFPSEERETRNFAEEIEVVKEKLEECPVGYAIGFRMAGTYYTVTVLNPFENVRYLYLSSPITVDREVKTEMITQIVFVSIVVFGLAVVVTGVLSSGITGPIAELSKKTKLMGKGCPNVNFDVSANSSYKELRELSQSLTEMKEELQKSDVMQKELIANVSHDFKTPLTMIKAYASMIQEISGCDPEKRNKHCQVIIDESDRLSALVSDLLDISKINAGTETLKPSIFDLSEYTEAISDRFSYLEVTQGYRIETDIAPNLYTEADKDKIGQVLYNLIGNAVNYTGKDKKIYIRLLEDHGFIRFYVTDTGKGIAKEDLPFIWDRYYRSSEMHKRPVKGTGLGLSIVKTILSKHRFNYGVSSEVGIGTTFYVEFPMRTVWNIETQKDEE